MTTRPAIPFRHIRLPRVEMWLCLLLLFQVAHAEPTRINGRVVSVADGDTLTILAADHVQHKIRLAGIDAPEKAQPFGQRSRQHLAQLAHGTDAATLQCNKTDRYRRKVCKVMVQPPDCPTCDKTLDVGLAQLTVGAAWWYRDHANEQSPDNRAWYSVAEQDARTQKLGLWRDNDA